MGTRIEGISGWSGALSLIALAAAVSPAGLPIRAVGQEPASTAGAGEPQLLEGLEELEKLLDSRRWKQAEKVARALMAEHASQGYVLKHRTELVDGLKEALFRQTYQAVKPAQLVSGHLLQYRESVGTLKVRYTGDQLSDFEQRVEVIGEGQRPDKVYSFPAVFTGPFEVRWSGTGYPDVIGDNQSPLMLLFRPDPERAYMASVGHASVKVGAEEDEEGEVNYFEWVPARMISLDGGQETVLSQQDSPAKAGQSYVVEATVESDRIVVKYGGLVLFDVKRPKGEFGTFGFLGFDRLESVEIDGKVELSWMRRLQDDHEHQAWRLFEESFDVCAQAPPELCLESCGAFSDESGLFEEKFSPDELAGLDLDEVLSALETGSPEKISEAIEALELALLDGKTSAYRFYVLCHLNLTLGRFEPARDYASRWLDAKPRSRAARAVHAQLALLTDRPSEARAGFELLAREDPEDRVALAWYARALLLSGALDDLDELLASTARNKLFTTELAQVQETADMARRGPRWAKSFEVESPNFVVSSDIDRKTSIEVSEHLESSQARFIARLGAPPPDNRRNKVFVFSGSSGYERYVGRAWGHEAESTAGMYHSDLGQLLIWNVPDRRQLFETVRHEGFHQYMDRLVEDAPIWLDEGLAEYFENAQFRRGPSQEIVKHPEHIATLTLEGVELLALEDLLYLGSREFYSQPERNYAQAWALVHFLLNSSRENQTHFDVLLQALRAGKSPREATRMAFEEADLERLERELVDHIRTL